jgi:hypothetical protein
MRSNGSREGFEFVYRLAPIRKDSLCNRLVDRIIACSLHLHHLEVIYAVKDSMSLELGAYYQRTLSATQKRYLAAIKALAVVLKLAISVLQVNIARKEVSVAGASPVTEN